MAERGCNCENHMNRFEKGYTWEWYECTTCGRHICIISVPPRHPGLRKEDSRHG